MMDLENHHLGTIMKIIQAGIIILKSVNKSSRSNRIFIKSQVFFSKILQNYKGNMNVLHPSKNG